MPGAGLGERLAGHVRGKDGSRTIFLLAVGAVVGMLIGSVLIPNAPETDVRSTGGRGGAALGGDEALEFGEALTGDAEASGAEGGGVGPAGRGPSGAAGGGDGAGGGALGGSGGAGAAGVVPGGPARGVTDTKIKIGVALPDIEAFGAVDEGFDVGDQRAQMEAVVDGWRKDGTLPIHGRDVELVYETFNILDPEQKIAVCNRLVKDHEVFAVLAGRFFEAGAECVADRFNTPVVSVNSGLDEFYARSAPYLFTIRPPWTILFRNWVAWADSNGHFAGRRIGLFFESELKPAVDVGIKQEMKRRGISIVEEVEASGAGLGTSQDQVAVQRFQSARVNLVMFVGGGTSAINFMTFAESQGYRPDYIDTDYGEHTTDAAASALPPNQYAGTPAMTTTRVGEVAAGLALPAETSDCIADYERFTGVDVGPRSPESAEYNSLLIACDLADVMMRGLVAAGRGLDNRTLIAGLESLKGLPMAVHGNLSFGPGRRWGVEQQRSVQWLRECGCWVARSPQMQPLA